MANIRTQITTPGKTENKKFYWYISDCKFVTRKSGMDIERMLRFTLTWAIDDGDPDGPLGMKIRGCLAYRWYNKRTGEVILIWSPPKTRNGTFYHVNALISPVLYERVKREIERSDYCRYIGPSDEAVERLRQSNPHYVDPNLPLEMGDVAAFSPKPEDTVQREDEMLLTDGSVIDIIPEPEPESEDSGKEGDDG